MTENTHPAALTMTPDELIKAMEATFNGGIIFTPDQAKAAKEWLDKLLHEGRGSTLDFSDPANSGLIAVL